MNWTISWSVTRIAVICYAPHSVLHILPSQLITLMAALSLALLVSPTLERDDFLRKFRTACKICAAGFVFQLGEKKQENKT